jgi:hypothetical protein
MSEIGDDRRPTRPERGQHGNQEDEPDLEDPGRHHDDPDRDPGSSKSDVATEPSPPTSEAAMSEPEVLGEDR